MLAGNDALSDEGSGLKATVVDLQHSGQQLQPLQHAQQCFNSEDTTEQCERDVEYYEELAELNVRLFRVSVEEARRSALDEWRKDVQAFGVGARALELFEQSGWVLKVRSAAEQVSAASAEAAAQAAAAAASKYRQEAAAAAAAAEKQVSTPQREAVQGSNLTGQEFFFGAMLTLFFLWAMGAALQEIADRLAITLYPVTTL